MENNTAHIEKTLQIPESILTPQCEPFTFGGIQMDNEGYIFLHRKIMQWEWFDDHNTFRLFVCCLLLANWKDKIWHGIEIKRGQFVTSLEKLVNISTLTLQQVRTSLKRLILTNEITSKSTNKNRMITVLNYDKYQNDLLDYNKQINKQIDNQTTIKQQSNNKQITTTNKDNKEKNINKEKNNIFVKPTIQEISDYCIERNNSINAEKFFDHYETRGWIPKGYTRQMKDWRAAVRTWEKSDFAKPVETQSPVTDLSVYQKALRSVPVGFWIRTADATELVHRVGFYEDSQTGKRVDYNEFGNIDFVKLGKR